MITTEWKLDSDSTDRIGLQQWTETGCSCHWKGRLPSGLLSDWAWWRISLAKAAYFRRASSSQRRSASFLLAMNLFSVSSPAVHS